MKPAVSLISLSVALLALPVLGAGPLEALRGSAQANREAVAELKGKQLTLRNELSALAGRIEQLKGQSKGRLLPGGELDASLKRSQELSSALTGLAQQLSGREADLESSTLALLAALNQELTTLRAEFDRQQDRGVRRALIERMKQARAECETLRATLPAAKVPAFDALAPSDDPTVLLEQADLLRDNQEKVEKELKVLEGRIAERRQEVELDRRVQRFMGEESMFDDQDRRLRVSGTRALTTTPAVSGTQVGGSAAPGATGDKGAYDSNLPGETRVSGSDARPQVGGASALSGDERDLKDLEATRVRLQGLASELKKKALELEGRAASLH